MAIKPTTSSEILPPVLLKSRCQEAHSMGCSKKIIGFWNEHISEIILKIKVGLAVARKSNKGLANSGAFPTVILMARNILFTGF